MNKVSIVLQDKQIINELVNDPDFEIRIKDSIIDGIGKRAVKLMDANTTIKGVVEKISTAISDEMVKKVFTTDSYYRKKFREEIQERIEQEVSGEFEKCLSNEVRKLRDSLESEFREELKQMKKEVSRKLESVDVESLVRKEARDVIEEKLGR